MEKLYCGLSAETAKMMMQKVPVVKVIPECYTMARLPFRRRSISHHQVDDVAPLAALTALQHLHLRGTAVANVAPLAALTALQIMW